MKGKDRCSKNSQDWLETETILNNEIRKSFDLKEKADSVEKFSCSVCNLEKYSTYLEKNLYFKDRIKCGSGVLNFGKYIISFLLYFKISA
jgi:hypothetical protein